MWVVPYTVFPPKEGTRVLPPSFLTWFPLMRSLECLICFDLMEKLYLPPPFFFYLGETLHIVNRIIEPSKTFCELIKTCHPTDTTHKRGALLMLYIRKLDSLVPRPLPPAFVACSTCRGSLGTRL